MGFNLPIVSLELPAYSKKENWGASETLYQLVRGLLKDRGPASDSHDPTRWKEAGRRPRVNLIGPSLLGFRCRDDVIEISRLLASHGIDVNTVVPLEATVADVRRLPDADLNVCLYRRDRRIVLQLDGTAIWDSLHTNHADRCGRHSRFPCEGAWPSRHGGTLIQGKGSTVPNCLGIRHPLTRLISLANGCSSLEMEAMCWRRHALPTKSWAFSVVGLGTYSREMARPVRCGQRAGARRLDQ